jgi:DNA polymerase-2
LPRAFLLQPTYHVRRGAPVVELYARLESGEPCVVRDDRFRPYCFAPASAEAWLRAQGIDFSRETELRALSGVALLRIRATLPGDLAPLRDRLRDAGYASHEADLRFAYRFLIDLGIRAGFEIRGPRSSLDNGLTCFENPELAPAEVSVPLRALSLDLETTPDASEIFCAALAGEGVDEVHLVSRARVAGACCYASEAELLKGVAERVRSLDPDLLTGWNVVDFDLRVWQRRAAALAARADLGRVPGAIELQQDPGFTREWRARVPGRVVLDGIPLVRDALRLPDYRLETAAQAILGRGKRIDADVVDKAAEIARLYREDPAALVAYNREDARLVLDLLAKEGLIELAIERSQLSGMPLDRVGASVAAFDRLYLPELRARGFVAPSVSRDASSEPIRGGALIEPTPGLYRDVAVCDWKSLYPSLIRTFGLDPLAHALALGDGAGAIAAPNGARFARSGAILPELIERLQARREAAKRAGRRHADQAIKIMMNALFGVLGSSGCRFFDPAIANAITSFGQQTLAWTREAFEACGVRVLYGDTDSVFAQLPQPTASRGEELELAESLRARVERAVGDRVRATYRVEPHLVLELECVYERLMLPSVRGGGAGSKKRYAGWRDGELEIIGLESVRRDWPPIAGRLQEQLLRDLFQDRDPTPAARALVAQLRAGELDSELVYAKRLRKGSLESYTATSPPHVQAARRAGVPLGPVVRYVITEAGPEALIPGRRLAARIDTAHYLEHVLRPVADAILPFAGHSFDEVLGHPRQLSLL